MHEPKKMYMMCMVLSPNCCAVTILNIQQLRSRYLAVCQFQVNTLLRKANGRVQI